MIKFYKRTQYFILYAISLLLIGITSLIDKNSGINFENLRNFTWYVDQIVTSFAIITTVMATVYMIVDNYKQNDKEYLSLEQEIKVFANTDYVPTHFSRYLDNINLKRKKAQYEFNVKKKLYHLEKKASDKDLLLWATGTDKQKDKNYYCRKRKKFEERLSEEWINKNIKFIFVAFDKITSSLVLGGHFSKEDNDSPNDFITKYTESKVVRDKVPTLILGIAITSMASSIVVTLLFNDAALLSVATKFFVLLFQVYNSIKYANDWNERITLKDIRFRKAISQEYKVWLRQQVIKTEDK
jgi:hypothetical protein